MYRNVDACMIQYNSVIKMKINMTYILFNLLYNKY